MWELPQPIAEAVLAVQGGINRLGKTEQNTYDNYAFASIDAFIEMVSPLTREAGLVIVQNEAGQKIVSDPNNRLPWLETHYDFILALKDGTTAKPIRRSVVMRLTGPQTTGSAQSYGLKSFMRSLFLIPTGEPDGDEVEQERPQNTHRNDRASGPRGGSRQEGPPTLARTSDAATPQDSFSGEDEKAAQRLIDGMNKQYGLSRLDKYSRDNADVYRRLPRPLQQKVYEHYAAQRERYLHHVPEKEDKDG